VTVEIKMEEGTKVAPGTTLASLSGPARALLSGERVALNLVQQLSGVATLTRQYVDAVAGTNAKILDTRKTVLGMRVAQKYAVRCGGGVNHRMGLYDAVLIKDNHIAVAGGVAAAVTAAREYARTMTIEVECDTLAQLGEALAAGVDTVLLDNMSNAQLHEAVATVRAHNAALNSLPQRGRVGVGAELAKPVGGLEAPSVEVSRASRLEMDNNSCAHSAPHLTSPLWGEEFPRGYVMTEASGNVNLQTVRAIAETGVDYISVGKLTHSAVAVDIGLDEA
jgi:nicotinate-nucleotide pyrophosphorylase (carboxylating)